MKKQLFHLYLNDDEYRKVLQALIALKNNLIEQGRYTDAATDVLINLSKARKKTHSCSFREQLFIALAGVFPAFAKFQNVS